MKNSFDPISSRLIAQPSATAFFSAAGACTMIMSTFLSLSSCMDSPVPALTQHRVVFSFLANASPSAFSSPSSPGLPVARLNTLEPLP